MTQKQTEGVMTMTGLKIKAINGNEFTVFGKVTFKEFPDHGKIYYCGGESWPEEIVEEILSEGGQDNA